MDITLSMRLQELQGDPLVGPQCEPSCVPTWLKLSRALCRFACIPVGASLVILMEFSRMPWGMMWLSGEGAGSALMKTRKSWWLPSLCCSSFFSRELSHLATRWMFWKGQRGQSFISSPAFPPALSNHWMYRMAAAKAMPYKLMLAPLVPVCHSQPQIFCHIKYTCKFKIISINHQQWRKLLMGRLGCRWWCSPCCYGNVRLTKQNCFPGCTKLKWKCLFIFNRTLRTLNISYCEKKSHTGGFSKTFNIKYLFIHATN